MINCFVLLLYASSLCAIWHDLIKICSPAFLTVKQIDHNNIRITLINRDNRTVIISIPNPITNLKCMLTHHDNYTGVPSAMIGRSDPPVLMIGRKIIRKSTCGGADGT